MTGVSGVLAVYRKYHKEKTASVKEPDKVKEPEKGAQSEDLEVREITREEAMPWILERHYAKRMCTISYAFGVYRKQELIGIVTYGTPASSTLRDGVCGKVWSGKVIELNRLCCENSKNVASFLVGRSLRMLPKPSVVVSYADTAQGHVGYVYQATNFVYTGLSAKRPEYKLKGSDRHGTSITDEARGQEHPIAWLKEKYGSDFYTIDRPRKHRYIYFCGNKRQRSEMRACLKYGVEEYPKGETHHS